MSTLVTCHNNMEEYREYAGDALYTGGIQDKKISV